MTITSMQIYVDFDICDSVCAHTFVRYLCVHRKCGKYSSRVSQLLDDMPSIRVHCEPKWK